MSEPVAHIVPGAGRRDIAVDVFAPAAGAGNGVAIVLLHGGGWARGHRAMVHGYARLLAEHGFTALAAEYRLLPEAAWPAQIEDVRDVVRWAKTNAGALAIDGAKIGLVGFSAGAHLALLVGGTQPGSGFEDRLGGTAAGSEVAAIVSFFAPARLDANPAALDHPPLRDLLGGGGIEAARAASPVQYVHAGFPTTFVVGGMADYMQPLESGLGLLKALVDAGVEAEFHYFHSQVHEFPGTPAMMPGVMAEIAFFFRRTLIDRALIAAQAKETNIFARASNPQEFARLAAGG